MMMRLNPLGGLGGLKSYVVEEDISLYGIVYEYKI